MPRRLHSASVFHHRALLAALGVAATLPAQATFPIYIWQQGANVVAVAGGAIDTGALQAKGSGTRPAAGGWATPNAAQLAQYAGTAYDRYSNATVTGPAHFGTGGMAPMDTVSGDTFAFSIGGGITIDVPSSYARNGRLGGRGQWNNTTLAALGLTPGRYTWTFSNGAQSDSLQMCIGEDACGANTAPGFALPGGVQVLKDVGSPRRSRVMLPRTDGGADVAGWAQYRLARWRLRPDGRPDLFSPAALVIPPTNTTDEGRAALRQPDGKLLIAGFRNTGLAQDFVIARFDDEGGLDMGFGPGGITTIDPSGGYDEGNAIALQSSGRIVMAGRIGQPGGSAMGAVRLNADGSRDMSFGGSGLVSVGVPGGSGTAQAVAVLPSGQIMLAGRVTSAGTTTIDLALRDADGGALNNANVTAGDSPDVGAGAILTLADGSVIVGGSTLAGGTPQWVLLKTLPNSVALDPAFGSNGKVLVSVPGAGGGIEALALQADGKIVAAGNAGGFTIARFNSYGGPDTSFGSGGMATPIPGSNLTRAYGVAVLPGGKILATGTRGTGGETPIAVRLNAGGSLDNTFGEPADSALDSSAYVTAGVPAVLDTSVAAFDAELAAQGHYAGAVFTLARSGGPNAGDTFGATGQLSFNGGHAVLAGTTIGTVSNGGGTLAITFNANATQARVNAALSAISYTYPVSGNDNEIGLRWRIADGNTGAQGAGGELATDQVMEVNIRPAPTPVTVTTPGGDITVELLPSANGCALQTASYSAPPTPLPPGVASFPYGLLGFTIDGCTSGATATLRVTYPGSVAGMRYYKRMGGDWLSMAGAATLTGNTATLQLQDGGPFDANPLPGAIADPGGPALLAVPAGGNAQPVPTLSPWALALLAALLGSWAAFNTCRRGFAPSVRAPASSTDGRA